MLPFDSLFDAVRHVTNPMHVWSGGGVSVCCKHPSRGDKVVVWVWVPDAGWQVDGYRPTPKVEVPVMTPLGLSCDGPPGPGQCYARPPFANLQRPL